MSTRGTAGLSSACLTFSVCTGLTSKMAAGWRQPPVPWPWPWQHSGFRAAFFSEVFSPFQPQTQAATHPFIPRLELAKCRPVHFSSPPKRSKPTRRQSVSDLHLARGQPPPILCMPPARSQRLQPPTQKFATCSLLNSTIPPLVPEGLPGSSCSPSLVALGREGLACQVARHIPQQLHSPVMTLPIASQLNRQG